MATEHENLRSEVMKSERRSNGVLVFFAFLLLVGVIIALFNQQQIIARLKDTAEKNKQLIEEQTGIITGQTQLIKDGNEGIFCAIAILAEHANVDLNIKYDKTACITRLQGTNNFDGTFSRDDLVPPSQQPPKPNSQATPPPSNQTNPGLLGNVRDALGNLLKGNL